MDAVNHEKRKATVLIADDDDDLRRTLAMVLERDGYEVIESPDGEHALELLAEAADGKRPAPDVLLLDFRMPGLSGIGMLRVLRRFSRLPPTIVVTAFPDPSVERLARNAGAVGVLRKPVRAPEVCAAVAAALGS